ncbi:MAG: glutathione S-transferase [Betaproteobacteria bacterium]|nr:glutathione S-transferase [Betaproteobacteria bacterium]
MRLIGMLDSPYVRRVAISLKLMGLPFTHESVSVFRQFEHFSAINPLVKAPTFVADDGTVLMESTVILNYLDTLVPESARLMPAGALAARQVGVALTAMEKSVQVYYELTLRPEDKRHLPWMERVSAQMQSAFDLMEGMVGDGKRWLHGGAPTQPDLCIAIAWRFAQFVLAERVPAARYPGLVAFSARAEALPAFVETPLE